MKLIDHCYAIRTLISKGVPSDDSSYSLSLIAHLLHTARALLTEQKADKYVFISEQSYQDVCLDLELSSFHNCCDVPDLNCHVLKSTTPIPKLLNSRWGDFISIYTLTGQVISKLTLTNSKYASSSLTGIDKKTGWFVHNNYLYIVHNTKLQKVILNGLFADPEQISNLNCSTSGGTCPAFLDSEYPIDSDLVMPAYQLTLQYLTSSLNMPPRDNESNAKDDQT